MKTNLFYDETKHSKVEVYDAIMGSGKTYDAIKRMKKYLKEKKKFIYVTPFLSEIKRVAENFNNEDIAIPKDDK